MGARWRPCRAAEPARGAGTATLLILLFGIMGLVTRLLCADADGYSSFWPANAAMLAALLTLRARLSVLVLAACFGLNLVLNRLSHLSSDESVLACGLNVLEALLVALPTRRFCGALTDLTRLRRLATFAVIAAIANGLQAAIGVAFEAVFLQDRGNIVGDWLQWVLCDTLGLLLATPTVLATIRRLGPRPALAASPAPASAEPLVLLALTVGLTIVSFLFARSFLFLLLYPAMVTLAFRARPAWVLATVLIMSIFVSALTAHGLGPIAFLSPDGRMMRENMLQPYLLSLFLSALPANNALGDKQRVALRLSRMRATLEHAATHDPLTGLMNRQLFKKRLLARVRSGAGGTVLFIDLDHFKRVNDTFGHQAGDLVLRSFGERMAERARSFGGEVARFGGDEFAMFLPHELATGEMDAFCATILQAARTPYQAGADAVPLSVSIGAAALGIAGGTIDEVLRKADLALYTAKDAGRDRYRPFASLLGETSQGAIERMPALAAIVAR